MATLQGRSDQVIDAPPSRIWQVLEDSSRLPDWVPVVERMTEHEEREREGSVRRCEVAMGGRRGYMVERCLESIPERKLRHAVEDDSLGFTRMFRDYSFTLELDPRGVHATLVTCTTFYEPRGLLARLMNALVMRRRFASVRTDILRGLKTLTEGTPESPTPAVTIGSAIPPSTGEGPSGLFAKARSVNSEPELPRGPGPDRRPTQPAPAARGSETSRARARPALPRAGRGG